jgi:hypothetical protein
MPTRRPESPEPLSTASQVDRIMRGQLTRADLANMTPAEITQAREQGKLQALLTSPNKASQ